MASAALLLLLSALLLLAATASSAVPHRPKTQSLSFQAHSAAAGASPTTYFEVTRPPNFDAPEITGCAWDILNHDFASTYGRPPVTAPYRPLPHCPFHLTPSLIVLKWSAAAAGRQFDRIFGLWLGGVELLRSCTAEPRPPPGTVWTVSKDVTRHASLFASPSTLAVYLGNIVDSTYTAVYHVNVSLTFFFLPSAHSHPPPPPFAAPADLILPLSRPLSPGLNDGLWFPINNASDAHSATVAIPTNAYRAVLEVYVSFHEQDEFFYTNPTNDYIAANNISGSPGNGPFREVTVTVDGDTVGAVWPFTVIYTGGINPLLWRPITGLGSFDLPSYDIEITPFLGKLLDGKPHKFGFAVTNALNVWYIDANLHLWLDKKRSHTVGKLIKHEAPKFAPAVSYQFHGLDGHLRTAASRKISATGWVNSSHGNITTHFFQTLNYKNKMEFSANGSNQAVNQSIEFDYGTYAKHPASVLYSEQVFQSFPLYVYMGSSDEVNDSYSLITNVSLGFNVKKFSGGRRFGFSFSTLKNSQNADGYMRVKGNLVTGGLGSTQQLYKYEGTDGCYFRNVSSHNYTMLHDKSGESCNEGSTSWKPFKPRRMSLASDVYDANDRN